MRLLRSDCPRSGTGFHLGQIALRTKNRPAAVVLARSSSMSTGGVSIPLARSSAWWIAGKPLIRSSKRKHRVNSRRGRPTKQGAFACRRFTWWTDFDARALHLNPKSRSFRRPALPCRSHPGLFCFPTDLLGKQHVKRRTALEGDLLSP